MISEYKIYLVIIFWLLLIYFLGVRRYSKLFQNFFNGRPIRYVIKQISQNSFKSFCSGFGVAFLMQSSFGAINHIKSYVQSGLINFKQMGMFLSGGQLASCLSPLILLAVLDIPKKIIIGTLLLSLFLKVFLPKVRFWLVDLLLVSSIFMLSFTELIFASDYISLNFSDYLTPLVVFAIGFLLTIIFKSYLYSSLVFFLLLAKSVDVNSFYIYIFSIHIALALYFLFSSIRYNSSVKKAFLLKVLSVAGAGALMFRFHGQVLLATEELLTPIISNTIYSNLLDSGEDIYKLFNQWLNIKPTYSASHVVYFVVLNLFFVCSFILTNVILVFIVNKFFGKVSSNKPKQMQSLVFPSNTQFFSPYLYLDHFKSLY